MKETDHQEITQALQLVNGPPYYKSSNTDVLSKKDPAFIMFWDTDSDVQNLEQDTKEPYYIAKFTKTQTKEVADF